MNYGQHPHTPSSLLAKEAPGNTPNPATDAYLDELHDALRIARRNLAEAKAVQKSYADKLRKEYTFEIGDKVMLDTRWIDAAQGPSSKLNYRAVGPFKVLQVVSPTAVKLQLPAEWRVHPVINISRMRPYFDGEELFPGRRPREYHTYAEDPKPREWRDIEQIVGLRRDGQTRNKQLLVRWKGLDVTYDEFVNEDEVKRILERQFNLAGRRGKTEVTNIKTRLKQQLARFEKKNT